MWAIAGALGLAAGDVYPLTLRQLVAMHEGHLLETWDRTAAVAAELRNLSILLVNALGKKRVPFVGLSDMHPFRKARPRGLRITTENFNDLKLVAAAANRR